MSESPGHLKKRGGFKIRRICLILGTQKQLNPTMHPVFQKLTGLLRPSIGRLVLLVAFIISGLHTIAQCPPNIDFEAGDFRGWQCWVGTHYILPSGLDTIDVGTVPVPPDPLRHVMLSTIPGDGLDPYGGFRVNCPNGSLHSIKLGNTTTTSGLSRAQGVSYTFTIPPGQDKFSLVYHYAVVFLESVSPPHSPEQQASLTIEVKILDDNTLLGCSSFSFHATSGLPGFYNSPINPNVKCKDWAAASINLDGYAGKTVQVFFKSATCTPSGHWGYAYLDLNSTCSSLFNGATYCPDDTAIDVTAPYGYQDYRWFDIYNNTLGTTQVLHLSPPPTSGDSVYVQLTPYSGYGCLDTLTAHLWDTLTVIADAGRDTSICNSNTVQLGRSPEPDLVYDWTPVTGLSDPNIANPVATPTVTTQYILAVRHSGGGCLTYDTVNITVAQLSDSLQLIGSASYCTGSGQTSVLKVFAADSIQWYRNGVAIPGATQTTYTVTQSGLYHAVIFSFAGSGCQVTTRQQQIDIYESPVAGFTTNVINQCFQGNQFVFTNTSTISSGTLSYSWDLGDGTLLNSADVIHTYAAAGTYTVKMRVTNGGTCADSASQVVTVYASPATSFTVNNPDQCFKTNNFVFTNTSTISSGTLKYTWDMGDGTFLNTRDVNYTYAASGTYQVVLTCSDVAGFCVDTKQMIVSVYPSPVAGFTVNTTTQCVAGNLFVFTNTSTISSGSMTYSWDMGDGVILTSTDVTHRYAQAGTYTVKLSALSGAGTCTDIYTMIITVYPVAYPSFHVTPVCTDLRVPLINLTKDVPGTTVNYSWDLGNGVTSTIRTPIYSYPLPGTYTISLSVNTTQCPLPVLVSSQVIKIDAPTPGIRYPDVNAISYFSEPLHARPIGNSIMWTPATSLDNRFGYHPYFYGPSDQLYTIKMKTPVGCETVDTLYVKVRKNIKIYVPKAFTPGGDGKNDRLKPFLMSFVRLNYFRVFDRWGKQLFEMRSDGPGWDGLVNGNPTETQTLVWMIEAVDVDGVIHREQGTTILIR